jgi:DNA processing protein
MKEDTKYWIALDFINGIGDVRAKTLYGRFKSADKIFSASENELRGIEGLGEKILRAIRTFDDWGKVEEELIKIRKSGAAFVPLNDSSYPPQLLQIYNPPPFLLMNGGFTPGDKISIAIVGTRLPDKYGRTVTEALSGELASLGVTIVSGMARGIDSIAQEEALKRGGRTIAVLGSGIDVVYPPENGRLYEKITKSGAVVSEFRLGTPPVAQNFPKRNRIISGLSLGVVVVQASDKSGSLISASFALDQNKEVFAVPGNVGRKLSRGSNWLIKKGAKLVETVDDILCEIEVLRGLKDGSAGEAAQIDLTRLSDREKTVYSVLGTEPVHIDEIIKSSGLESSSVLSLLLSLELDGYVAQHPGKLFRRRF